MDTAARIWVEGDSSSSGQLLGFPYGFCRFTKGTGLPWHSSICQFSTWHHVWKLQAGRNLGCMGCSVEHIRPLLFGKSHMKFNYPWSHPRAVTHSKVHSRKRKIVNLFSNKGFSFLFFFKGCWFSFNNVRSKCTKDEAKLKRLIQING